MSRVIGEHTASAIYVSTVERLYHDPHPRPRRPCRGRPVGGAGVWLVGSLINGDEIGREVDVLRNPRNKHKKAFDGIALSIVIQLADYLESLSDNELKAAKKAAKAIGTTNCAWYLHDQREAIDEALRSEGCRRHNIKQQAMTAK